MRNGARLWPTPSASVSTWTQYTLRGGWRRHRHSTASKTSCPRSPIPHGWSMSASQRSVHGLPRRPRQPPGSTLYSATRVRRRHIWHLPPFCHQHPHASTGNCRRHIDLAGPGFALCSLLPIPAISVHPLFAAVAFLPLQIPSSKTVAKQLLQHGLAVTSRRKVFPDHHPDVEDAEWSPPLPTPVRDRLHDRWTQQAFFPPPHSDWRRCLTLCDNVSQEQARLCAGRACLLELLDRLSMFEVSPALLAPSPPARMREGGTHLVVSLTASLTA